ncbi:unnamed protein product [Urochloa decumbens]|uniref:AAA+ ATPase domain-containing protein n=1 Tax=Urochloa decumbens TaxID=240449 RepID=A0ABC9GDH4_9POAL
MEGAIVSAATGAMSCVLAKLGELLHDKYKLAKRVRKDIEFLRSELSFMNGLLCTLADVEELDPLKKEWRNMVRELAYDVEDCIDRSVTQLDRADDAKGGFGAKLARKLKKIRVSHQVAHHIQELKDRVIEESKRHKRYKLDVLVGSSSDASRNKVDLRMSALWEETKNLVGLDGPRDEIIRLLMCAEGEQPSQQVRTVSIVGCAGLGKTTLASQVYQKIQGGFECKAFISVSQNPRIKDLLMNICSQVGATANMMDSELILVDKLRERLQHKRYIVVVDDIWHSDPWKIIGKALIETSPGSIIIITTRLKDVAESCCSHGGRVYDMKPLDNKNSRRLFFKRIFDSEEKCPQELERASKDILEKCDGIPLAIISISSFLAVDVPQSPDHWNKVKESISSPLPGNKPVETMKSVLSLSYFNLPHHLRTCLLYLSAFPEDCIIQRDRLVNRWIAEGFVNAEPGESLYEAGLTNFNVLINRSLIQPWQEWNGVVCSCRVHDVILNFLLSKSVEENFLTLLDPSGPPPSLHSKVRRLSIQKSCQENVVSWTKSIKPHVRSLAYFEDCGKELHPLTEFEVVRVLDLENCESLRNDHLANIEVLLQLRYLNIRGTIVSELPAGIGQVQHLETLNIRDTRVEKLPSTIVLLEKLARLFVSGTVQFPAEGFSKMKGLEQLCFSIHGQPLSFLKELGHLTNLRILEADCNDVNYYEGSEWGIFTSSLHALCSHKLVDVKIYGMGLTSIPTGSSFPAALHSLRKFFIVFNPISNVPVWMGSLVNLEALQLEIERFTPEAPRVLGGMPVLETLDLYFPDDSYAGPFTIGRHEFQRLKLFRVRRLYQLQFMPGSMPNLKHLYISLIFTRDSSYSDLGIQHLASITNVEIGISAWRDHRGGVEDLEAKIRSLLDTHPNRPTLIIKTYFN